MTGSMVERKFVVRVELDGRVGWGLAADDQVFELEAQPECRSLKPGRRLGTLLELPLLAPVTPSKIVCVGRNYAAHAKEHGVEVPDEPLVFLKPPSSIVGPGEPIVLPERSERVEHEAELALVIGRRGRHIAAEDAWDHVFGVTCANDVSARDLQREDGQWSRAKGFDSFCPIGPWIAIGLDAADVSDLEITCSVGDSLRQQGRTSQMVFSPSRLIAHMSSVMTLEVGDVILTGTPAGVGPLEVGDEVRVEIEGIGTLTNPVA